MADNVIPQYVVELIKKIAKNEKFTNYSISNESGSADGDGFQSILLRFVISGMRNNKNDKLSLICKIPVSNIGRREGFHSDDIFYRELDFYEQIFPYFEKFQNQLGVYGDDGFFSYPKCYGSIRDEKVLGNHAIVMENLNDKGFQMLNKMDEIDFAHSALVFKELGKLHAVSFAIRHHEPEKFKEFMKVSPSKFHEDTDNLLIQELQKSHFSRAARSLDPSETTLIEKINQLKATYTDFIRDIKSKNCEPFAVLIQGDCWINNLLYSYDEKNHPSKVCLIDWQLAEYASPAFDLSCVLFCSLSPELRNNHFNDLVNVYYNSLELTLTKFGCDAKKLFTYENLQDQLREFAKYVMILGPIMIGIMTSDPKNTPSMDEVMVRLEKLKEDPAAEIYLDDVFEENDAYKHRMSNMIRDMVRMGFW